MHVLSKLGSSNVADLLRRVAAKDRAAFAELYATTSSKLLGVILRILQRRSISEEVLQEVYVKIWERAADYNPALS
jgi:RNA polymerase sigma-70 factor (ECF subfamily)